MLQRIQSIWLLLAAGFDAVTFRFPFANGDYIKDNFQAIIDLDANSTVWLSILTVFAGVLAFINIFLFNNRPLQLKLCYLGIGLSALLLVMYFLEWENYINGTIAVWIVFYFAILACFIFAAIGIKKDEKLIKSMDRLR